MKKFSSILSIVLTLSIILGNFTLPVFAYDKGSANLEQIKTGTKTLSSTNGTILNKLNSAPKSTNALLKDLSINKGSATLEKSQQVEGKRKDYIEGEILVKYKNTKINLDTVLGRATALNFTNSKSLEKKEDLIKNNISVLKIKDTKTVEQKIAELKNDPNVEYAQPNFQYYPTDFANDTYAEFMWGIHNYEQTVGGTYAINNPGSWDSSTHAAYAWSINEGTNSTAIVAVIDDGVAYNHPDLVDNMWNGSNCTGTDGLGNLISGGCNHGYDYQDNDKIPLPTDGSHGTHIAGTIAAVKNNNIGILGVAPNAKIMALKTDYSTSQIIQSIDFAKQNGAKVINASWATYSTIAGGYYDVALYNAIGGFPGLFIAATGNGKNTGAGFNHDDGVDAHKSYPTGFKVTTSIGPGLNNIISVAATDQKDALATFSDYGATSVDVGAPGVNILSTVSGSTFDGTAALNETFEGITPPNIPSGWVKGGITNKWATYDHNDGFWDTVLYSNLPSWPYDNNANTTITSPTYNLGGNTSGATIDFWAACDTVYLFDGWYDYMQLEYSSDGVNFFLPPDPYLGDSGDGFRWDEPTFDINNGDSIDDTGSSTFHYKNISIPAQYLTSNFKFRFRWVTDSSDNYYDGCYVDDIKITKFSDGSDEGYDYSNGTSMATPHVAGLAALIEGYNPNLTTSQVKNIILTTGDSLSSLNGKTTTGKRINAYNALLASNPAKAITAFNFVAPTATGVVINETTHTISATVPFGTNVTALVPTITITGASVSPISGVAQDFTSPVTYTVTAADSSTQAYVVTVTVATNTVSGNITTDTTWTLANSPYIVTGTVQVLEGATLTIESGVTVKFNSAVGLNIGGELITEGTADNIITFTSNQSVPKAGDWNGIKFFDTAIGSNIDSNHNYINGSIIKYSKIAYAGVSIDGGQTPLFIDNSIIEFSESAIYLNASNNIISNNIIRNNGIGKNCGYITIATQKNNNYIINNIIDSNGSTGLNMYDSDNSHVLNNKLTNNACGLKFFGSYNEINNNLIANNKEYYGIEYYGSGMGSSVLGNVMKNNTIINNNNIGIYFYKYNFDLSKVEMINNNIYNNSNYNFLLDDSTKNVDIKNNYWGTTDSATIANKIYDYYDNISLGKVIYEPFATTEFNNTAKAITSFSFATPAVTGVITEATHTIAITVPFGTVVSALVPTITITGASVSPLNGVAQNFTSPVTYTVTAVDASIQAYVVTVTIAPATNFTISGIIKYYDGVKVIPNATVILENGTGEQMTTTTDTNGAYQFTGVINGGDYVVRVSKSDNIASNGMNIFDLIATRRQIAEIEIFDQIFKKIAADVNNDLSINIFDLIQIRRYVAEIDSLPSHAWKFYSSNAILTTSNYLTEGLTRTYNNLTANSPNQDFVGVKMGDVNNSWVNN